MTDDLGQTAQFYMARTDHHCESVVQPFLNQCMSKRILCSNWEYNIRGFMYLKA